MHKVRNIIYLVIIGVAIVCAFFLDSGIKSFDDGSRIREKNNDDMTEVLEATTDNNSNLNDLEEKNKTDNELENINDGNSSRNTVSNIDDFNDANNIDNNKLENNTTDVVDSDDLNVSESVDDLQGSTWNYYIYDEEQVNKKIDEILSHMTLEEKVGQIFFIKDDGRFDSSVLKSYPVGGIILFAGDFKGKDKNTLISYIEQFQKDSIYPLLIGTDEEGGSVVRVSNNSNLAQKQFLSPKDVFAEGGYDAIAKDTSVKSRLLLDYGINVNFAPVCDVVPNPRDFMYRRSFSGNSEEVCKYIETVVSVMNREQIGSVMKHFPGYGSNADTHRSVVRDTRTMQSFKENDLKPFEAGIENGADCILVSHNIVECFDPDNPASLSEKVHTYIRKNLNFEGVIITDDLMMGGVDNLLKKDEAAVAALVAGNDMILSTDYEIQYKAILEAIKKGEISEDLLDDAIIRILKWKIKIGLIKI